MRERERPNSTMENNMEMKFAALQVYQLKL